MVQPIEFYANLHLHSIFSDGVWTPEELVHKAKEEGYGAVALTDHDTISGCERMRLAAEKEGLEYLFGCEFSVNKPYGVHITAFEFDPEYPEMKDYLSFLSKRVADQTRAAFEDAMEEGVTFGLHWQDVLDENPGVTWICHEQVRRTFENRNVLKRSEYYAWKAAHFDERLKRFPKQGEMLPLADLIDLVHRAGGIAVLAHPLYHLHYIDEILKAGIDGIEVWHADQKQPEAEMSLRIALKHGLYISGGSDHSGLLGGSYGFFDSEYECVRNCLYIPDHCCGTTKECFDEMKYRRLTR